MWETIDVNGNGYVSLAEITKVTALSKKQTLLAHCKQKKISKILNKGSARRDRCERSNGCGTGDQQGLPSRQEDL
jgi:hypothetical protein